VKPVAEPKHFYLICYDIRDPKRWRKAHRLLKGYGETLQYSIFRCRLNQRDREKLRWELEKVLAQEDSLLIAGLCDRCVERIQACNRPEVWSVNQEKFQVF
jgi:CRISPR-associated protein Cas2